MSYFALDRSIWSSTVLKQGPVVVSTWMLLMVDADKDGITRATPSAIASLLRVPDKEVEKAFKVLASPDPHSRNREHQGKRIIAMEHGAWQLVSYKRYKNIVSKAKHVRAQQNYRERQKNPLIPEGGRPKMESEGYRLINEIVAADPKLTELDGAQVLIECAGWTDRDGDFHSKPRLDTMSDDHLIRTIADLRARLEDTLMRTRKKK